MSGGGRGRGREEGGGGVGRREGAVAEKQRGGALLPPRPSLLPAPPPAAHARRPGRPQIRPRSARLAVAVGAVCVAAEGDSGTGPLHAQDAAGRALTGAAGAGCCRRRCRREDGECGRDPGERRVRAGCVWCGRPLGLETRGEDSGGHGRARRALRVRGF